MYIRTFFISFVISLFLSFSLYSQEMEEKICNKQLFAEFGGPGDLFSVNIDNRFSSTSRLGWGYRVGVGFGVLYEDIFTKIEQDDDNGDWYLYDYEEKTTTYATVPVVVNYILGNSTSPHTFEIGLGTTFLSKKINLYNWDDDAASGHFIAHVHFMYRRQPLTSGFTWRIGLMPVLGTAGDISLSAAVGIGFAF